jgi:hypothetical protein
MTDSAGTLLVRAKASGAMREDVRLDDLMRLVHGITMATEDDPNDEELGGRLFELAMRGLRRP